MQRWAAVFLVIGIIAGISLQISWILFVVGLILAIAFFIVGRRAPVWRPLWCRWNE